MDSVTRFTAMPSIGQQNSFRRDSSRSTHDVQLNEVEMGLGQYQCQVTNWIKHNDERLQLVTTSHCRICLQ